MITIIKCEPTYNKDRGCWRLHIRYAGPDGEKRTYLALPLRDERRDAKAAKIRATAFRNKADPLWEEWSAQFSPKVPPDAASVVRASPTNRVDPVDRLDWLLQACLNHEEVWGRVANPKNYQSTVNRLTRMFGDWPISGFEPAAGGRAKVMDIVDALRLDKLADGTVRKLVGAVHQALRAAIGDGVSSPIVHPTTQQPLLSDVPAFPFLKKSPPREKVIDSREEATIFEVIDDLTATAVAEENAFSAKLANTPDPTHRLRLENGWHRTRRFSSAQWRLYRQFVRLLIETGMRRGEALWCGPHALQAIDLLDDDGTVIQAVPVIHLIGAVTKTSLPRDVNISQPVADMLEELNANAQPYTVVRKNETIHIPKAWFPVPEDTMYNLWVAVRKEALKRNVDLSKAHLHTLRHTNATNLRRRGMPIDELAKHLGHSNISTTLKNYEHVGNQKTAMSARFFSGKSIGRAGAKDASNRPPVARLPFIRIG